VGVDRTFQEQRIEHARSVRRRLVAHIRSGGTTDMAPCNMRLPASCYTDPERWRVERRRLFEERPVIACLSRDIPQTGDSIAFKVLGHSVIIVRDSDGQVRAFRNRCAHRGAQLLREDPSIVRNSGRLTCPFHGWSYDLTGALSNIPGQEGFDSASVAACRLASVAATEWAGAVFVQARGDMPLDILGYLGSFGPLLASLEMDRMTRVQSSGLVARTNWKYAIDTYAENYHFGVLHAKSIGESHFTNIAAFEPHGQHWMLNFAERQLAVLARRPEDEWPDAHHNGTYFIFPNSIIVAGDLEPGERFIRLFRIFPGDTPGEMSCIFSVYTSGLSADEFHARFAEGDDSKADITREDYDIAEGAWSNLITAEPDFTLTLGRNEVAVQAFHRAVFAATGLPP
jgi:Phenylpropionate dioxygenase and related ring-hydroxylating dioxygenases, large terminal subunit